MRTTKPVTGVEPGTGGFELQEAVCFIPVFMMMVVLMVI